MNSRDRMAEEAAGRMLQDLKQRDGAAERMKILTNAEDAVNVAEATLKVEAPPFEISTPADSFVTRYVNYASKRTDAPKEAHELTAAAILSALAGPNPVIPLATHLRGVSLGLWTLYIVNSTVGRKTTVLGIARDLIVSVLGEEAVLNWEGSPQGLIQRLQDRDGQTAVFVRDEYSGLLQQMNRQGGHLAGLEQLFIRAFDGQVLENIRTRKKDKADTDRVERPYLVKVTASTWDSFMERASIDNVLDGFLARFVFVTGSAEPRPALLMSDALRGEHNDLLMSLKAFHDRARNVTRVVPEPEVLEAFWGLQQRWRAEAEETSRSAAAVPMFQRLSEAVLKVAALLAIDLTKRPRLVSDGDMTSDYEVPLTKEHFEAALGMGERWLFSARQVLAGLDGTSFQRRCDDVAAFVAKFPRGVVHREVARKNRGIKTRDLYEVLRALMDQERIWSHEYKPDRGGHPTVIYFPGAQPGRETQEAQEAEEKK